MYAETATKKDFEKDPGLRSGHVLYKGDGIVYSLSTPEYFRIMGEYPPQMPSAVPVSSDATIQLQRKVNALSEQLTALAQQNAELMAQLAVSQAQKPKGN